VDCQALKTEEEIGTITTGSIKWVSRITPSLMIVDLEDGRSMIILGGIVQIVDETNDMMSMIALKREDKELVAIEVSDVADELVDWKISKAIISDSGQHYGFVASKGKLEKRVWILRDTEGNGPGFLGIDPA
jgi:hypothetical protein